MTAWWSNCEVESRAPHRDLPGNPEWLAVSQKEAFSQGERYQIGDGSGAEVSAKQDAMECHSATARDHAGKLESFQRHQGRPHEDIKATMYTEYGQAAFHPPIFVGLYATREDEALTVAMTPSLFRQLAVANLIVPFIGVAVDVVRSPATADVEPFTMSDGIRSAIALLFIAIFIATSIGFCFFARWSRPVALCFLAAAVAWTALDGPSQSAPLAQALYDLSSLLSGATLAAAYWSPVSRLFEPGKAEDDLREVFR